MASELGLARPVSDTFHPLASHSHSPHSSPQSSVLRRLQTRAVTHRAWSQISSSCQEDGGFELSSSTEISVFQIFESFFGGVAWSLLVDSDYIVIVAFEKAMDSN